MDVWSTASSIAFGIDASHRGMLSTESVGKDLEWGDLEGISRLIKQIAVREGVGDLLAEGVKIASQRIGSAQDYTFHVKGLEIPGRDPRGKWDIWMLGYLTSTRGGDHLRTRAPTDSLTAEVGNYLEEPLVAPAEYVAGLDMPREIKKDIFGDPPFRADIPLLAKYSEDLSSIINSVGLCNRPPVLRSLGPDFYARALKVVTGIDYTAEELLRIGENIWNLQHQFNLREGETGDEYVFPHRFYEEDLPAGPITKKRLDKKQVDQAVQRYFSLRGWYS